jgi:diguanylate cyclase (GGDEF)-like protein/PAS domain S-box-containing protein
MSGMTPCPMPPDEPARLASLHALAIVDTPPEPQFDALVRVAARATGAPIAMFVLIDAGRAWVKAAVGVAPGTAMPRAQTFCAHALLDDAMLEVPDARLDARFADLPAVAGAAGVRAYAGLPVRLADGARVGTLCVLGREPARLGDGPREVLHQLALAAAHALEGRRAAREVHEERRRLAYIVDAMRCGTWEWNVRTGEARFDAQWARIVGRTTEALGPASIDTWLGLSHPDDLRRSELELQRHFAGETEFYECELRMRHRDGHWVWVHDRGRVQTRGPDGAPEWMYGTHLDITDRKRQEEALRESRRFLDRTGEVAGVGGWEFDVVTERLVWSAVTCRLHGVPPGTQPTPAQAAGFFPDEVRPRIREAIGRAIAHGDGWDMELPLVQADGRRIWVRSAGAVEHEDGAPRRLVGAFQDITESRALKAELARQHELLQVTLRSIADAVVTTDADGRVVWLNPVAERLTGWTTADARGRPLRQVYRVVDGTAGEAGHEVGCGCPEPGCVQGAPEHGELVARDGTRFGVQASASPIRTDRGALLGTVLVFRDVTEERRLAREMTWRATHDALTGLVNRAEFESRLHRALEAARDAGREHALLWIDLDQFKLVNDACGHAVGDELLRQVGVLLARGLRPVDTLARLGGDEFAVILEHCPEAAAQRVAQQMCDRIEAFRFDHAGQRHRVGASIGLVPVDGRWPGVAAILQAADSACYAAKEAGRNRVHAWFDTDLAIRERHGEMQWATRIAQALDEGRFVLHAQRVTPIGAGALPGLHAEVLVRMVERDGTLVSPGAFLPAAERFHLASRLDRWVLARALDWLRSRPAARAMRSLAVNLSGQSLGDPAFHRDAIELLRAAGPQACARLCVEITETAAIARMADAAAFTERIRALGVRVGLDDFGAGASSFGYLKTLKVDFLKIDGQFIRDLIDDPLDAAAVRCFVEVARAIGLRTIAEFVEGPQVLARLREIGVDYAQGFLLHRPEPIDALLAPGAAAADDAGGAGREAEVAELSPPA